LHVAESRKNNGDEIDNWTKESQNKKTEDGNQG